MLGSTFFALKFGTFSAFFDILATCCLLHVMSASYRVLLNTKCTIKIGCKQLLQDLEIELHLLVLMLMIKRANTMSILLCQEKIVSFVGIAVIMDMGEE